jgi:hypothetical protein
MTDKTSRIPFIKFSWDIGENRVKLQRFIKSCIVKNYKEEDIVKMFTLFKRCGITDDDITKELHTMYQTVDNIRNIRLNL